MISSVSVLCEDLKVMNGLAYMGKRGELMVVMEYNKWWGWLGLNVKEGKCGGTGVVLCCVMCYTVVRCYVVWCALVRLTAVYCGAVRCVVVL